MILLFPTKEYWFSKIHMDMKRIVDNSLFYEIPNVLANEIMHIEIPNENDDIYWFKRNFGDNLGAKLLEIDRFYGTEFFINSYFYSKNTSKRINKSDLYHEFEQEYDSLFVEAMNRLK